MPAKAPDPNTRPFPRAVFLDELRRGPVRGDQLGDRTSRHDAVVLDVRSTERASRGRLRGDHATVGEQAAFPLPFVRAQKYWPPVKRVDNVHGDRNLVCTCAPLEDYANQQLQQAAE